MRTILLALLACAAAAHPFDLMVNQITHQRHIAHRNAPHANYSRYRSLNATLEAPESLLSVTFQTLVHSLDPVVDLIRSVVDSWHTNAPQPKPNSQVLVY